MSARSKYSLSRTYSVSFRLSVRPTKLYGSGNLVNSLCKYVPIYTLCTRLYLNLGYVRTGMHAMVHRIGASAAAAQLHLTARPTGQKWSAASSCRSKTSTGPAAAEWSAQQVGSSWWPRAGGRRRCRRCAGPGWRRGAARLCQNIYFNPYLSLSGDHHARGRRLLNFWCRSAVTRVGAGAGQGQGTFPPTRPSTQFAPGRAQFRHQIYAKPCTHQQNLCPKRSSSELI